MGKTKESDGRCPVGKAMGKLTPGERKDMQSILDNGIPSHVIVVWFDKYRSTRLSAEGVTRHRRKSCSCYAQRDEES
jgi:hypothetical protein